MALAVLQQQDVWGNVQAVHLCHLFVAECVQVVLQWFHQSQQLACDSTSTEPLH